ncbi:AAA-ATPase At3g50940 isoform X3 [Jatropha curcas]|uniref:AAA-ATPase At3g50940 isoform X3 n=1 Tax=Jatropha curcas TaxID=180498 RepID=UPI00189378EA|nr:AAA-ATPase At3g50940 isoform X3 [Jatropha curcas]
MSPTITKKMPSTKTIISAAASAAATAMLLRSVARDYVPTELRHYIYYKLETFFSSFSSELTLVIEEYDNLNSNDLFKAAELYLEPIIPPDTKRLKISMPKKEGKVSISLEKNQEVIDIFNGVTFKWKLISKEVGPKYIPRQDHYNNATFVTHHKFFELSFHKKFKKMALENYLKHIVEKSKEMKEKKKTLKLFTLLQDRVLGRDGWHSVNLDHPATFDTLAMDLDVKKTIMGDLERFVKRKEYYKRVGKAWKRGYLLFGPPGTGKSSFIAAMANYLKFDIYDLELSELRNNSELRKLLISTENKSILVVEDIDCSIELQNRIAESRAHTARLQNGYINPGNQFQVTLSGLLNFIDGLWSSCGDERIIIFTTNHKEKLDPALLRSGRMDVHLHMSYCTPCGFKMLASNYLGITDAEYPLFTDVEELIEMTKVTPAEIGEQLMKSEEPEIALRGLIEFLEHKIDDDERKKREELSVAAEAEGSQKLEIENGNVEKRVGIRNNQD